MGATLQPTVGSQMASSNALTSTGGRTLTDVEELKSMAAQNQSLNEVENQINQLSGAEVSGDNMIKLAKLNDLYAYMLDPSGYAQRQVKQQQHDAERKAIMDATRARQAAKQT